MVVVIWLLFGRKIVPDSCYHPLLFIWQQGVGRWNPWLEDISDCYGYSTIDPSDGKKSRWNLSSRQRSGRRWHRVNGYRDRSGKEWFPPTWEQPHSIPVTTYVDSGLLDATRWGSEGNGGLAKGQVDPLEDTTATSPVELGNISLWDPPSETGQTSRWNVTYVNDTERWAWGFWVGNLRDTTGHLQSSVRRLQVPSRTGTYNT